MRTRKKLIEVALPLDAINAAWAREKSIRWVRDFFFEDHRVSSRLPVVTRRLTDLDSLGEQRVLSQARYCVGGPAATKCRTSTEANTSSQDLNSHGCLPVLCQNLIHW